MEPAALLALRDANRAIDVTSLLPNIAAPTLVVHKGDSDFAAHRLRQNLSPTPDPDARTRHRSVLP